jgi:hypothetical protein
VRWTFAAIATTMVVAGTPHHAASAYTPTKQPAAGQNWQTMGFSPTNPTESSRRDSKFIASEVGRSPIDGIILGGNVGPYLSGLHPAHIKSRITAGDYARAG